jgi:patatin-related protein
VVTIDEQEVRVGVVMNGGVSLAVWMGGVTRELDRLRRCDGAYGEIAKLTCTTPRIDVIAGASAGGINGAMLAIAIARGGVVDPIGKLWLDDGSIEQLLRDPMVPDAPSLFRGDERLLERLGAAVEKVAKPTREPADHPLHLTITGTALVGEVKSYADHFGAVIPDVDHRVQFRFRTGEVGPVPDGKPWPNDFNGELALGQLALAARSSASFPVAFEPSFCPAGDTPDVAGMDKYHPNMRSVAGFDESRWVIDGGVLVNTPFRPALDAIATMGAENEVRRVLAYVVPNPVAEAVAADKRDPIPSPITIATDAGSRIPRVQSIGRELEEIANNNKAVDRRVQSRNCTLQDLNGKELEQAAAFLLSSYRCMRGESAIVDIVDLVLAGRRDQDYIAWKQHGTESGPDRREQPWRRAPSFAAVEALRAALRGSDKPWIPPDTPWETLDFKTWSWGMAPVENAGNLTLDVLRRAIRLEEMRGAGDKIRELRAALHKQLLALRWIIATNAEFWRGHAELLDDSDQLPERIGKVMDDWPDTVKGVRGIANGIARILDDLSQQLYRVDLNKTSEAWRLRERLDTFVVPETARDDRIPQIVRRLLALDVVQRSSGADISGIEQKIELVLMSAEAGNAFDEPARPPERKLAGLQVHHFGSFYKRSWRANDWMWGRLDGSDRIVRTLLDPRRVRRLMDAGASAADICAALRGIAVPEAKEGSAFDADSVAWLAGEWEKAKILDELEKFDQPDVPGDPDTRKTPVSTDLERTYEVLRRRIQIEILYDEIPRVRDAANSDVRRKTSGQATGADWAAGLPSEGPLPALAACEAFRDCDIGTEVLADEAGSDYFTKVSTTTLGVVGSMVHGLKIWSGLKTAQSTVRGILLSLYLLGRGVLTGSRTGSFLVALVLALGGALVALFLLGVNIPGFLGLLGATLLIAGVLLGLVQDDRVRIGLVFLVYAGTVAAYYGVTQWHDQPAWVDTVATTATVVVLALAATALGASRGRFARTALAVLAVLAFGAVLYAVIRKWDERPDWVDPLAIAAAAFVVAIPAIALALRGRQGEGDKARHRVAPVALGVLAGILLALAAAALLLPAGEAKGKSTTPTVPAPPPKPLTKEQIETIDKQIAEVVRKDPILGNILQGVAAGSPAALAALSTYLQTAKQVPEDLARLALAAAARGGFSTRVTNKLSTTFSTTLKPEFSLGGLSFAFGGAPAQVTFGDLNLALIGSSSPQREVDAMLGDKSFAFKSAKLSDSGRSALREIRAALASDPSAIRHIEIRGYADYVGSRARNLELSEERALTVKRYLLRGSGVSEDLVTIAPYGEDEALASTRSDPRRHYDRRVDVVVLREQSG